MKRLSLPLVLVAAAIGWFLLDDGAPQPTVRSVTAPAPGPDSYAVDVSAREYRRDGELRSHTTARRLQRHAAAARVDFEAPRRREFSGDGQWFASADAGTLRERDGTLLLEGAARLQFIDAAAEMHTEALLIDLRGQTAQSLDAVHLEQQPGHWLRSERLVADLRRQRATFAGNVTSGYAPPH